MDGIAWPPFIQAKMDHLKVNDTCAFSPGMMDNFLLTAGHASPLIQLLLMAYRFLGTHFGLDPPMLLTMLGLTWGLPKLLDQVYAVIQSYIGQYLMCAMSVREHDHIYLHLMNFLSLQKSVLNNRYLMAETVWKSAWEEEEELENSLLLTDGDDNDGEPKYLNFASQAARSGPRYVPAMGTTSFWHKGTYFRINRSRESLMNTSGLSAMKDLEEIRISCFGRSMDPIKHLLADAKKTFYFDTCRKTTIYRPRPKEQRLDGNMWHQVARRPVRPMRTVVLDSDEKKHVLGDINEYLHPATPRWYSSRGIPLRRGYLFHGPPGTGKTSFSFALAGVFGIDIYVISLQDANVSEENLAVLFTRLPRRCIVLLEDIDTAGLRRAPEIKTEDETQKTDDEKKKEKEKGVKKAKNKASKKKKKAVEVTDDSESDGSSSEEEQPLKKPQRRTRSKGHGLNAPINGVVTMEGISLSGLLNAIDGVASHEGRVLIMTTNKPESLDDALIRPGRVDLQVAFTNATSTQAGELFHRMYEASRVRRHHEKPVVKMNESKLSKMLGQNDDVVDVTEDELNEIAGDFGKLIPENLFSPAEIQGFLLKRKQSPRKALEEAPAWIEATVKQKETRSKVLTVQ